MTNTFFGGNIAPAPIANSNVGTAPTTSTSIGTQGQCNVHYVSGMDDVLNYPASPNEHFYFPETENNVIWVRETDAKGQIRNPLKKLSYTMEDVAFGPEANFVTKQEHQQLYDLVSAMNVTINRLMDELGGTK